MSWKANLLLLLLNNKCKLQHDMHMSAAVLMPWQEGVTIAVVPLRSCGP